MIWVLGEYADKIDQVEKLLEHFTECFNDESIKVQLSILTAAVKMYLRKPDDCEELVMGILKKSTEESDNPDLRDRGYIYWRMLSTDPQATKFVVLGDKPEFNLDDTDGYDEGFLNNLIENIGCLSSVYHITPDDIEIP
jgi:vesicle coat complex subunit